MTVPVLLPAFFPLSDESSDGLYTYEGSDEPDVSTGRPTGNIFRNNEILSTEEGVKITNADDTEFFGEKQCGDTFSISLKIRWYTSQGVIGSE